MPSIQGGCGGSQESRETWNRRGSSRREAEMGRGSEEAGETDGKTEEVPRRRLQPAGGGGTLRCPCLPASGADDRVCSLLFISGRSWLSPEGLGRGLEVWGDTVADRRNERRLERFPTFGPVGEERRKSSGFGHLVLQGDTYPLPGADFVVTTSSPKKAPQTWSHA